MSRLKTKILLYCIYAFLRHLLKRRAVVQVVITVNDDPETFVFRTPALITTIFSLLKSRIETANGKLLWINISFDRQNILNV